MSIDRLMMMSFCFLLLSENLLAMNGAEPVQACAECFRMRTKCSAEKPCHRCVEESISCQPREQKKRGRKLLRNTGKHRLEVQVLEKQSEGAEGNASVSSLKPGETRVLRKRNCSTREKTEDRARAKRNMPTKKITRAQACKECHKAHAACSITKPCMRCVSESKVCEPRGYKRLGRRPLAKSEEPMEEVLVPAARQEIHDHVTRRDDFSATMLIEDEEECARETVQCHSPEKIEASTEILDWKKFLLVDCDPLISNMEASPELAAPWSYYFPGNDDMSFGSVLPDAETKLWWETDN